MAVAVATALCRRAKEFTRGTPRQSEAATSNAALDAVQIAELLVVATALCRRAKEFTRGTPRQSEAATSSAALSSSWRCRWRSRLRLTSSGAIAVKQNAVCAQVAYERM